MELMTLTGFWISRGKSSAGLWNMQSCFVVQSCLWKHSIFFFCRKKINILAKILLDKLDKRKTNLPLHLEWGLPAIIVQHRTGVTAQRFPFSPSHSGIANRANLKNTKRKNMEGNGENYMYKRLALVLKLLGNGIISQSRIVRQIKKRGEESSIEGVMCLL